MEHQRARELLVERRLSAELRRALNEHLSGCEECKRLEVGERELIAVLEEKLPQYPASLALKRRLAETVAAAQRLPAPLRAVSPLRRRLLAFAPLAAAAALAIGLLPLALRNRSAAPIAAEAVGDHLRLLEGELALQIVSSGIHEVKPWFAGKLDFAPLVSFAGDAEYPLQGGAVARFLDRKAALLVYKRREHRISLFVLRPDGLDWPKHRSETVRGFHLLLWRGGDLGYALVSDLDEQELAALATRLRSDG